MNMLRLRALGDDQVIRKLHGTNTRSNLEQVKSLDRQSTHGMYCGGKRSAKHVIVCQGPNMSKPCLVSR